MAARSSIISVLNKEDDNKKDSSKSVQWWDKNRANLHGEINLKFKRLSIDVLTHTNSDSLDCLRLGIENAYFGTSEGSVKVLLNEISLSRLIQSHQYLTERLQLGPNQTSIIKVPTIEVVLNYDWHSIKELSNKIQDHFFLHKFSHALNKGKEFSATGLYLMAKINIPNKQEAHLEHLHFPDIDIQKMIEMSPVPILHYQAELFSSLIGLPQLSQEYLQKIGIRPINLGALDTTSQAAKPKPEEVLLNTGAVPTDGNLSDSDKSVHNPAPKSARSSHSRVDLFKNLEQNIRGVTELLRNNDLNEQFSSYLDLMAFTLNEQINSSDKSSLFRFLKTIQLKMNSTNIRLLMTNLQEAHKINLVGRKDEQQCYKMVGLQGIVSSIGFECQLYKKVDQII